MYRFIKRLLDIILSLILVIVISPLLIIIAIVVEIQMGHPFYFTQIRITKGLREFRLIKFRSMTNERDENGELLPDDQRRTKFGNLLRATSLDELPELYNIIRGDMSIIGPRPLLPNQNPYYRKEELDRFNVRGGLIPPEVLYGKTNPSWDEQLGWEGEYGRKCSFGLDVRILLSVFKILIKRNKEGFGAVSRSRLAIERADMVKKES